MINCRIRLERAGLSRPSPTRRPRRFGFNARSPPLLSSATHLFTARADWSDQQIVRGYRSQSHVEAAFRSMKDPHYLTFRPTHHWTDQKLRVHALYCVIALMITSPLRRQLAKAGIPLSLARMIRTLADIREVSKRPR